LSPQDSEPRTGHHVRAKDLVLVATLIDTAYLVISQLADIGFGTIVDELREAEPAWLILGLILTSATRSRSSNAGIRRAGSSSSNSRRRPTSRMLRRCVSRTGGRSV
jgi:hypothetical protein